LIGEIINGAHARAEVFEMKLMRTLALALLVMFIPLVAFAGSVVFTNNDGTFTSTGVTSGTLTLSGSSMIGIQGLSPYIPDSSVAPPASLGTLTLTTGSMIAGGNILTGATFGAGGNFTVTYANGVVFTGSFTSASWTLTAPNTWTFSGTVMNGTLTVPGYSPVTIGTAVTVDLTTVGAPPTASGSGYSFQDSQGTTNFPAPGVLTPVPEPGTLTLLGGGLVGFAILAKRRASKKAKASDSASR
jgi:hypothetical protein